MFPSFNMCRWNAVQVITRSQDVCLHCGLHVHTHRVEDVYTTNLLDCTVLTLPSGLSKQGTLLYMSPFLLIHYPHLAHLFLFPLHCLPLSLSLYGVVMLAIEISQIWDSQYIVGHTYKYLLQLCCLTTQLSCWQPQLSKCSHIVLLLSIVTVIAKYEQIWHLSIITLLLPTTALHAVN